MTEMEPSAGEGPSALPPPGPVISRRRLLALGGAGTVAVAATAAGLVLTGRGPDSAPVSSGAPAVGQAETRRPRSGRTITRTLSARRATVDLGGGKVVETWTYDGQLPGPEIRVSRGDRLRLRLTNQLPEDTTTHWRGLAIRNDMDGVPGTTMAPVPPGGSFEYDFVVPDAGTYWYHSHVGLQLDRGLYGAFIVDQQDGETDRYDVEATLLLDDWLDGLGTSPEQVLAGLAANGMTRAPSGWAGWAGQQEPEAGPVVRCRACWVGTRAT